MNWKKLFIFARKNYLITLFLLTIVFVGIVSVFKLFSSYSQPTFVYAKVKMGQGLWWSGGSKPSIWFVDAIKKGDVETDLLGKPVAQVQKVTYYPWWGTDQFDVYISVKLKVSVNKKTKKYNFKRSTLGVGAPIELEFSSVQLSGTVTDISEKELDEPYVEKQITLTKKWAYPWEYDAIKVGDKYFNGEDTIFEITGKNAQNTSTISNDPYGNSNPNITELKRYITVRAKIKVKEKGGQLIFGEDQIIRPGKLFNFSTPAFTFTDYAVGEIQ